jgi:tetratricopeptide (TPR) repeat protein
MDCEQIKREEMVERYLLGRLSESEQDAFELHYFECAHCFDEVKAHRSLREELARQRATIRTEAVRASAGWRWAWAVGAAAAVVVVSLGLWQRRPQVRPQPSTPVAVAPVSKAPEQTGTDHKTGEAGSTQVASLEELARFDPPRYSPAILRGPTDEATRRFREGMNFYSKGDYAGTIKKLRSTVELNPQAADARFFLGACFLLTGQSTEGIRELKETIALGESPYLEEAHFYLSKAYLQEGNVAEARKELQTTVRLHGDLENQARELLQKLEARGKKSDKDN